MKRLTAVLAAALITMAISTTAFAAPENSDKVEQQGTSSEAEQKESSVKTEESSTAPEKLTYTKYKPDNIGMTIDIPSDTYIITPDIKEKDPALSATNLTKEEVEKSFTENGTLVKAFAKDFSYDITLTMTESEKTQAIDNLSSLSENEIEQITDALLENDFAVGCSKNTYNGTLFLTFDTEYKMADTTIYGVQEYTIVNGKNIIITFQSHTGKLNDTYKEILAKVMSGTTFEGAETPMEISNAGSASVTELDPRYIAILIASVVGLIALASMIIVGIKYRQSRNSGNKKDDEEFIIKTPKTRIQVDDEKEITEKDEGPYDTSIFESSDENVLFTNKKIEEEKKQREKTRNIPKLDSTTELSIPKNPYTPVGKAEAVEQPAMSVTSQLVQLSNISAEEAKAAKDSDTEAESSKLESPDAVVFAESTPKPKTEIKQIGEDVFIRNEPVTDVSENTDTDLTQNNNFDEINTENGQIDIFSHDEEEIIIGSITDENDGVQPEEELSEYEKRFGKGRRNNLSNSSAPGDEEEKPLSKFEKHFGKLQPAAAKQTDTIAAVDTMIKQENTFADIGTAEKSNIQTPDRSPITITKAPPKTSQPTVTEQPVVKITKVTPMPTAVREEIEKAEHETAENKDETDKNNNTDISENKTTNIQTENEQTTDEPTDRDSILKKFSKKLFEADEQEEEKTGETNRESTNKFINSIRDKLQYRAPEYEDEQPKKPDKNNSEGTEIYHSPDAEKSKQIELSIKKNDDGSIVVDSISDATGKPVKIEIKDGNAELRSNSKSKRKNKKRSKNRNNTGTAVTAATDTVGAATKTTEVAAGVAAKTVTDAVRDTVNKAETAEHIISAAGDTIGSAVKPKECDSKADKGKTITNQPETEKNNTMKKGSDNAVITDDIIVDKRTEKAEDITATDNRREESADKTVTDTKSEETTDKVIVHTMAEETDNNPTTDTKADEIDDNSAADIKAEETADNPTADIKAEGTADNSTTDTKTEETADNSTADTKTEETADNSTADTKTDETADNSTANTKTDETADNSTADIKTEETADNSAVDTKTEETADNSTADTKTDETADNSTADTKTDETADNLTADSSTEENSNSENNSDSEIRGNIDNKPGATVMTEADNENINTGSGETHHAETPEPLVPEFIFERDSGIVFERAISPANNYTGNITPLTTIPKLESVNANDYNKQIEEIRKQSVENHNRQPEPQTEIVQPPMVEEQPIYYPEDNDDTLDPFAPGSGEMTLKEIDKKSTPKFKDRLKKSLGKIFSAGDDEK